MIITTAERIIKTAQADRTDVAIMLYVCRSTAKQLVVTTDHQAARLLHCNQTAGSLPSAAVQLQA